MPEPLSRIDAVILQPVLTTYVDGHPVAEHVGDARKVFLAANPDVAQAVSRVMRGEALPPAPVETNAGGE